MKGILITQILITVTLLSCWITNIVQFVDCDFDPIGKMEIIKGIGTFIPPASIVTVWF